MARLLLRERAAGSGSAWAPLLRVLSAAQCPWTWPASGRCCLAGTELAPVLWAKLVRLDTEYEKLPREFRTGRAEYREVCALVSATINPWFGGSIVPFNCTLNYSSAPPNVRFESDEGGRAVIGRALRTVQAGEELTQEYADSQADLIYRYGFADPAPSAGPGLRGRQRGGPPTGDVVSISVAQVVAGCSDGLLEPRRRAPAEREQLGAEALRLAGALAPCPWDGLGHELTAELAAAAEAYDDGPRAGAAPAGAKKRRRAALAPEDAAAAALVGAVTAAGEPERRELRSAARGARRGGDPWPALLAVAGRRRGAVARAREAAAAAVRLRLGPGDAVGRGPLPPTPDRLRALDEAEDAAVPSTGTDRPAAAGLMAQHLRCWAMSPAAAGLMAQHLRSVESRILHDAARVLRADATSRGTCAAVVVLCATRASAAMAGRGGPLARGRLLPALLLLAPGPHGAPRAAGAAAAEGGGCPPGAELDAVEERLHVSAVPFTRSPREFLARFEFDVRAPLSQAFRAGQFDVFPKPVGKLLNARPALAGFEAVLTQGRWKSDQWGPPPREFRPPGALLVAATNSSGAESEQVWQSLVAALGGWLCASFEGMDPDHPSLSWVRPLGVPWAEPGSRLQFATLPYEPVCTENLTPWLKLLPCGRHRGLAALLDPLEVAASPLKSLSLVASVSESSQHVQLRASLDVVLPLQSGRGLAAWSGEREFLQCPAAASTRVLVRVSGGRGNAAWDRFVGKAAEAIDTPDGGATLVFPAGDFSELDGSDELLLGGDAGPAPWVLARRERSEGLSVMRDVLSQEGRSERTHGRYLLRFANGADGGDGVARSVRFMDQLPFFIRPLWHTFLVTVERPGSEPEHLRGLAAMRRLDLRFVPSEGSPVPTEVFLTATIPPGGTVSVTLDVLKDFIRNREFSYACEKGFDVSSAAWLELAGPLGASGQNASVGAGDILRFGPAGQEQWQLRFTEGLLILVPMPDFSMPFNVVALTSTVLTFFFGSVFRITAAGKVPHWVLKKPAKPVNKKLQMLKRLLMVALIGGLYVLNGTDEKQLKEFRKTLPEEALLLADLLDGVKLLLDRLFGAGH
ncbi:unnamed protein product [Prorocentrum cordatum]|uniref:SET domain-containing protein n=1 Tax=Prorocentrum cordatum TaxID=2364126 RepID=A0ABN9TFP3_9DINO|nr:unnamed protein product [Polarella glacialis]